jgi:hypothetical protein
LYFVDTETVAILAIRWDLRYSDSVREKNVSGKSIYEYDGYRTFGSDSVVHNVTRAFAAAPVTNPDGRDSITLVIQLNEEIPHQDRISFEGEFETTIKNRWFGTLAERTDPNSVNILAAKRLVFHYASFGHQMTFGDSPVEEIHQV